MFRGRRVPRIPDEGIKIKIYTEDRKLYLGEGRLSDISIHGLCFKSEKTFNLNEKLILEFSLERKFEFLPLGKIVWVRKEKEGHLYGIEFIRIDPSEKGKLGKYVSCIKV